MVSSRLGWPPRHRVPRSRPACVGALRWATVVALSGLAAAACGRSTDRADRAERAGQAAPRVVVLDLTAVIPEAAGAAPRARPIAEGTAYLLPFEARLD